LERIVTKCEITDIQYDMLVFTSYKIWGNLRFLSHAETLKLFQRACVRADIELEHSKGFNPHPRLSLVLPRAVGVESDDELLVLHIHKESPELNSSEENQIPGQRYSEPEDICSAIRTRLSTQLPEGIELLSVSFPKTTRLPQPFSVNYILTIRPEYLKDNIKNIIESLLASEHLYIQRPVYKGGSRFNAKPLKFKNLDVRSFLKSIKLDQAGSPKRIIIECKITSVGSIRVDELLGLLELDIEKLAKPIKRTNVQWNNN